MKLYKMFDYNDYTFEGFWSSDLNVVLDNWHNVYDHDYYNINDEVEIRCFDTRDIKMDEYNKLNDDDYFDELSKPIKKFKLVEDLSEHENNENYSKWKEIDLN